MKKILSVLFFCGLLFSINGRAATRTIRFFGAGDNSAPYGRYAASPSASTCKLSIVNQSGVDQQYTLNLDTTNSKAINTGNGAISLTSTTPASLANATTYTLTNGQSHHYTWTYPVFPPHVIGTQHIECLGTITLLDVTNPGSIGFSGILNTYTEELQYSNMTTQSIPYGSAPLPSFIPLTTTQM